jgi:hypothetical protein
MYFLQLNHHSSIKWQVPSSLACSLSELERVEMYLNLIYVYLVTHTISKRCAAAAFSRLLCSQINSIFDGYSHIIECVTRRKLPSNERHTQVEIVM